MAAGHNKDPKILGGAENVSNERFVSVLQEERFKYHTQHTNHTVNELHIPGSTCLLELECSDETQTVAYRVEREENAEVIACKTSTNTSCIVQAQTDASTSLRTIKASKKLQNKKAKTKDVSQANKTDIRLAFKPKGVNNACDSSKTSEIPELNKEKIGADKNDASAPEKKIVFEFLGSLSPQKRDSRDKGTPIKQEQVGQNDVAVQNARRELGLMTPKKLIEQSKAIGLDEIRHKLNRSSRLTEICKSIKKFNKNDQVLKELEVQKKKLEHTSPRLQKFTSIELEVLASPQKTLSSDAANVCSPVKGSPLKKTPLKSPLTSPVKTPAFQRLAHLVQPGVPSLALPYSYRMLAEIFRCMDTVTSMMYNRNETVTFDKLKAGVQQMLRRNFTEQHIGQIKKILPDAFKFSQEKCSSIMSSKKTIKYQLVILPVIDSKKADVSRMINGSCLSLMTPSVLVERREQFHRNLLEFVKNHHEKFLKTLDPPVIIPRANLVRWHPGFELERVPPVMPAELPAAPNEEKSCTAKDVLDRARTLFGCNERMEKALQMVSEQMKKSEENTSLRVTSNPSDSNSSLLRGIPKALLEKVRAKQAAKALLAMTRTPAEDREAMQLLRLPEITRILRNIFVAEKKSVLPLEVALEKLSNSYREALSCGELEQHIRLLMKVVPGWVDILHIRKTDYLKVAKDADLSPVMRKLEKLATEKTSKL